MGNVHIAAHGTATIVGAPLVGARIGMHCKTTITMQAMHGRCLTMEGNVQRCGHGPHCHSLRGNDNNAGHAWSFCGAMYTIAGRRGTHKGCPPTLMA